MCHVEFCEINYDSDMVCVREIKQRYKVTISILDIHDMFSESHILFHEKIVFIWLSKGNIYFINAKDAKHQLQSVAYKNIIYSLLVNVLCSIV